ncbi:pyruvate dehydrogenase E1 component subunit beta, mitochondrial-like [Anabrus simplex]|uniref:pyruvate dehydrogenase E1 component subunit beta, mitochondrial-like n=1 Tax=Anabrus simplex TaxID=316456 RepID=UPI0035A35241
MSTRNASSSAFKISLRACQRMFSTSERTFKKMTVSEAINLTMDEEITRDERVFLIGEDVGLFEGAFKVSKGLLEKHGHKRIIDTPITESAFTGIAIGAALAGLRPICEFMTYNFSLQAIDQVVNSCAKILYMSGGKVACPIVFRGANGWTAGVGAQHAQCFASWYSSVPGLKVLSPYSSEDARGLLRAAIRDPDPVVILESSMLYNESHEVSQEVLSKDFIVPIGKAKIERPGKDVTIVSHSIGTKIALEGAKLLESEKIDSEVINLRTLRPLDSETIQKSVEKTHRLITVEFGWPQGGIGSSLCATVMESPAFFCLDAPPIRLTGADVPTPYASPLEKAAFPRPEDVVKNVKKLMKISIDPPKCGSK